METQKGEETKNAPDKEQVQETQKGEELKNAPDKEQVQEKKKQVVLKAPVEYSDSEEDGDVYAPIEYCIYMEDMHAKYAC